MTPLQAERSSAGPSGGDPTDRGAAPIAHVLGRVLTGAFTVAARIRPAAKPLHPRGHVRVGTLTRLGLDEPFGVPWLDVAGTDEVIVRFSRSAGLPAPLPDVLGLAIRVPVDTGHGDLLLSTSGSGVIGRHVLAPARRFGVATYSTLVPFRTPAGPLVILAAGRTDTPDRSLDLRAAVVRGPWRTFGRLDVPAAPTRDGDVAFDSVLNPVPGLEPYDWVRELRAGAYRAARHSRGDDRSAP